MNSPYLIYSLPELRTLRRSWLAEGAKRAQELRQVVETLGAPVGGCKFMPTVYKVLKTSMGQAKLYESSVGWGGDHWRLRGRLWVEVEGVVVCNLYFWDGEYLAERDSVYIPGPWIDEILEMGDAARAEIERCQAEKDEWARRQLIDELGIGKIV